MSIKSIHLAARCMDPCLFSIGTWIVFFILSVIGNLTSVSPLERAIFIPVSAVLSLLALRLAIEKYVMGPNNRAI